jgi:hypothetical protein
MSDDRYRQALIRITNEIVAAVLERRALIGLEQAGTGYRWDFFRVAYHGMFNDMIAHCIRALDRSSKSASFLYIYRCKHAEIDKFVNQAKIDWSLIVSMTDKLKHVRDKTHFHIDRNAVLNPQEIWKAADIRGKQLGDCLDSLWAIVDFLHARHFGLPFSAPSYDGTDAARIVKAAQQAGIT